jgi:hypothetical protein
MKLIQTFEQALDYANRLGLAGDPKDTVMSVKQDNLAYYVEEMLRACGQYKPNVGLPEQWPCIPFLAHWNRKAHQFTATVLGPGQDRKMVKAMQRKVRAEQKKKETSGNK